MQDLVVALCLVAVLEGLLLFVAPRAWKSGAQHLLAMPDARLRGSGAVLLAIGLVALLLVRG